MALLNNNYIFVEDENVKRSTNVPQHPVEKGLPLTDSIRNEPRELSIKGKIVNTKTKTAEQILAEIDKLRSSGSLISYKGRNLIGNFMIKSFSTTHVNTNWGGADFDMDLVEVRIAKSAYNASKQTANRAVVVNSPTLAVGATVIFTGGAVYVSSDAKKAAANRGRQTCKITKISTKSWSIHQYHLISIDKQYPNNVYGWVDRANITGTGSTTTTGANTTNTSSTTNGGTQQVKQNPVTMQRVGSLSAELIVGSASYLQQNTVTINGTQYYASGGRYYPTSYAKTKKYDGGRSTGKAFPAGTPIYRKA